MTHGTCYCQSGRTCPRHEAAINAAEDSYETPDDYDPSYLDNEFERANYPRLWGMHVRDMP